MMNYVTRKQYQKTLNRSKFWFCSTVILLLVSIILSTFLTISIVNKKECPIIVGHGTMQKIGDNMLEIVEDDNTTPVNIKEEELPELPAHLLK